MSSNHEPRVSTPSSLPALIDSLWDTYNRLLAGEVDVKQAATAKEYAVAMLRGMTLQVNVMKLANMKPDGFIAKKYGLPTSSEPTE